jgi:protein dithiol:quinone oxidoreductase
MSTGNFGFSVTFRRNSMSRTAALTGLPFGSLVSVKRVQASAISIATFVDNWRVTQFGNMSHAPVRTAPRTTLRLLVAGFLCFAGVAAALVSQYSFDMQPCPWCTLQRLIFIVLGLVALLAAYLSARPPQLPTRIASGVGLLVSLLGICAALWQHVVAAASASCALTLADKILQGTGVLALAPKLFSPKASCAEASVSMLGVPYALWSMSLFMVCGLLLAGPALKRPE